MRKYLALLLLFIAANVHAQDAYWKKWNAEYPSQDVISMLKRESAEMAAARKLHAIGKYSFRKAKYRFKVNILNTTSNIPDDQFNTINKIYKLSGGDPALLKSLFKKAILVQLGNQRIRMPIQDKILGSVKDEILPNDVVTVYCLYLEERTPANALNYNFLICEFKKDVNASLKVPYARKR